MNKFIIGECVDYTYDGKGIVKGEGVTVFVPNIIRGEKAKVEIVHKSNNQTLGVVKEFIKTEPNRVTPKCRFFKECGGCALQHMDYASQLAFKKEHVKECLAKIGHINMEVNDTLGMEVPYNYRNKTQVPFSSKKGKIRYGFYKQDTHDVVQFDKCLIQTTLADEVLQYTKELMTKFKIEAYDEDKRKGVIRHVLVRVGVHTNEAMIVLVTNVDNFPNRKLLVKELLKKFPSVKTIVQNINHRDTNVILGEKEFTLFGKGYIEDYILGVKFKISSKSFYQVNPTQTEVLYSKAIEMAKLDKNDLIIDTYCGIGTIGLIASKHVNRVLGVEIVKEAIVDAKNNANINDIKNATFVCDDAARFMVDLSIANETVDVIFLDPPRKGLDTSLIESVLKLKPRKVVYISCNPSTLARDLAYLKELYNITEVQPVDMFPHTYHVETIVLLCLKDAKK